MSISPILPIATSKPISADVIKESERKIVAASIALTSMKAAAAAADDSDIASVGTLPEEGGRPALGELTPSHANACRKTATFARVIGGTIGGTKRKAPNGDLAASENGHHLATSRTIVVRDQAKRTKAKAGTPPMALKVEGDSVYERRRQAAQIRQRVRITFNGTVVARGVISKKCALAPARVASAAFPIQKLPIAVFCEVMQFLVPAELRGDRMLNLTRHVEKDICKKRSLPDRNSSSVDSCLFKNKPTMSDFLGVLKLYLHGSFDQKKGRSFKLSPLMGLDLSILPLRRVSKTFHRILTKSPFDQLLSIKPDHIREAKWKYITEKMLSIQNRFSWLLFILTNRFILGKELLKEFLEFLIKQHPSELSTQVLDDLFFHDKCEFNRLFFMATNRYPKTVINVIYGAIVECYWKRNPNSWDRYNGVLLNNGHSNELHIKWLIAKLSAEKKGENRERVDLLMIQFFSQIDVIELLVFSGNIDSIKKLHRNFKPILTEQLSNKDVRELVVVGPHASSKKIKKIDDLCCFLLQKGLMEFRKDHAEFHKLLRSNRLPEIRKQYNQCRRERGLPDVELHPADAIASPARERESKATLDGGSRRRVAAAAAPAPNPADEEFEAVRLPSPKLNEVNAEILEVYLHDRSDNQWIDLYKQMFKSPDPDHARLIYQMLKQIGEIRPHLINQLCTDTFLFCRESPFNHEIADYLANYLLKTSIREDGTRVNPYYQAIVNHGYYNRDHLTWLLQKMENCPVKVKQFLLNCYFHLSTNWIGLQHPNHNSRTSFVHHLIMFGDLANLKKFHEQFPTELNNYLHRQPITPLDGPRLVSLSVRIIGDRIESEGLAIILDNIVDPTEVEDCLLFLMDHYHLFNISIEAVIKMGPSNFLAAMDASRLVERLKSGPFPLVYNKYQTIRDGIYQKAVRTMEQRKEIASRSKITSSKLVQTPGSAWTRIVPRGEPAKPKTK